MAGRLGVPTCALLICMGAMGCAASGGTGAVTTDSNPSTPAADEDMGPSAGPGGDTDEPDVATPVDRPDDPAEALPDEDRLPRLTTAQVSSGGGQGQSTGYRLSIRIGAPQPMGRAVGEGYRLRMGGATP